VANSDPPNEVNDCESPADRNVDAPNPNAFAEQVRNGCIQHPEQSHAKRNNQEPEHRRVLLQHHAANAVRNRAQRLAGADNRRPYSLRR
jgi:hypothetical protein